jgi:hypothetical protein
VATLKERSSLKERICAAFCAEIDVREIPNGFAIGTSHENSAGDRIGVYAIQGDDGAYRIMDTALSVALIESEGATLENSSRRAAFFDLITEYGIEYDQDYGELFIRNVSIDEIPNRILKFSYALLRLKDLIWLSVERTRDTFREDVRKAFRDALGGRADIREDEPVNDQLSEVVPDMVFAAAGHVPVALFIATNESKLWQAMHLQVLAEYETKTPLSVIALLKSEGDLPKKIVTKADNRLDAIPRYEDEPRAAIQRVVREVTGASSIGA